MRRLVTIFALGGLIVTASCSKKPTPSASGPQATVLLKDGSSFAGTVTKSSPDQITLTAPSHESRTYPMTQVASVQYATPQTSASNTPPPALPSAPEAAPAAAPAPAPAITTAAQPVQPAAPPAMVIPAGRAVTVRNNEMIDSHSAVAGQSYSAVVAHSVTDSRGRIIIPRGSSARLVVRSSRAQGKVEGESELALALDSVTVAGRSYRVETAAVVQKGREGLGANSRTGKFVGGGAVLGTILGAVAGGGRGAAIGAASGAAAGTATQTVTRGKGVRVPAESLLSFRLESPVRVAAR